jgi:peptide/nickel transport system permease protein
VSIDARVKLGGLVLFALVVFAVLGPWLSSHDPYQSDFAQGVGAQELPQPPSARYWLGTDRLFRDQLVRLAVGARFSLLIGVAATLLASTIGGMVGVISGYLEGGAGKRLPWATFVVALTTLVVDPGTLGLALGGLVALAVAVLARTSRGRWLSVEVNLDQALMTLVDIGLSFPFMLLVLALAATFERTTEWTVLLALGLSGWLGTARVVRAKTLEVRSRDFVTASRALGQPTTRLLWLHVWPNVRGPLLAVSAISVAQMILTESVLSYLGAGLSPPAPTWGRMLFEGQELFGAAPWLVLAPATFILLAVMGFNLVGEGLRRESHSGSPRDAS